MTTPATTAPTGRAAWTSRGGAITLTGRQGYYAYVAGEPLVGSAGIHAADLDHRAVAWGVVAIQAALNWHAQKTVVVPDGVFGPGTAAQVAAFQKAQHRYPFTDTAHPADPSGAVGKGTAFALFSPVLTAYCEGSGVPAGIAHGVVELESAWDPGAVGSTTPQDEGLAQWRVPMTHDGVAVDEAYAFGLFSSLKLLAQSMEDVYRSVGHWALVVMAHHAPAWAQITAATVGHWDPASPEGKSWAYLNVVLNHVS